MSRTLSVTLAYISVPLGVLGLGLAGPIVAETAETLYPLKDGTLVDGGIFGPFDGEPDDWDWTFNQSSYEGAITLTNKPEEHRIEHRVFFEYDLRNVTLEPPTTAVLRFVIRGAPIFPAPDAEVYVYAYPGDLVESVSDYSAGPAVFQGNAVVAPFSDPTAFAINVSRSVNEALLAGEAAVAFRFQINPDTLATASQAFIDALDSEPTTKPSLTLGEAIPGDGNGDGVVDLSDYALFADCMKGPNVPRSAGCATFDFDRDADVDLRDFKTFMSYAQ